MQRVSRAAVRVEGEQVGGFDEPGVLAYVGVTHDDTDAEAHWIARKIWDLRILREERSASDVDAPVLVISQFTLYADARRGNRPSFTGAAPADVADRLYGLFCDLAERDLGTGRVGRGAFGAHMRVSLVNDGPFTVMLDSEELGL